VGRHRPADVFICFAFLRTSSSSLDKKPATSAWVIPRSSASFRNNRSDGDHQSLVGGVSFSLVEQLWD
jgi:hypothetical protein